MRSPETVRAYAAMNTVRALERLAFADMSAPELADSLQVSVRTARRLLQRLALEGFVAQERGHRRRYHATLRLASLGRQMVEHARLAQAAAPRVARLAQDTSCAAHLWIPGYDGHIVCVVRADGRAGCPTVSVLCDVAPACSSAAAMVMRQAHADRPSSCYMDQEPTAAAAAVERGQIVGALCVTGDRAADARAAVVAAAGRLSLDLVSGP
jgi:DNA-binding IclR family transcriptional regulator